MKEKSKSHDLQRYNLLMSKDLSIINEDEEDV